MPQSGPNRGIIAAVVVHLLIRLDVVVCRERHRLSSSAPIRNKGCRRDGIFGVLRTGEGICIHTFNIYTLYYVLTVFRTRRALEFPKRRLVLKSVLAGRITESFLSIFYFRIYGRNEIQPLPATYRGTINAIGGAL